MSIKQKTTVDKTPEKIQELFGQIAPRYDFLNNFFSVGIARIWRRQTVRQVLQRLAKREQPLSRPILDVATGTGDILIEFQRQLKKTNAIRFELPTPEQFCFPVIGSLPSSPPHSEPEPLDNSRYHSFMEYRNNPLIGVDFTPEMLEIARKKAPGIFFMQADGTHLPFGDNSCSAVTISFGLRNMQHTELGLAEMVRVCQPGGVVAILEFTMPTFPILSTIYRFYFQKMMPRIGQKIAKNTHNAYNYLPESVSEFDDREKIVQRLKNHHLTEISAIPLTVGIATLYLARVPENKSE